MGIKTIEKKDAVKEVLTTMLASVGLLIGATLILFWDYLFGNKFFLFPIVVSDAVNQFYPAYVQSAQNFESVSSLGEFSFQNAWGTFIQIKNPFEILIAMGGEDKVAYMIGVVTALRIILAGTVFSVLLKEKGYQKTTCLIFALGYAFSLQVIGGGCWKTQAELAIIVPLFFLAIERFKKKKGFVCFFVATGLSYLCLSTYYLLTMLLFCIFYLWAGIFLKNRETAFRSKHLKLKILCVCVAITIVVFMCIPSIKEIILSYRFQEGILAFKDTWQKVFTKNNIKIMGTCFLRTYAPNILGIPGYNNYYGGELGWYIGDGGFYCGLLMPITFLLAYRKKDKKRNILYGIELLSCLVLMAFPPIRLVANGFADQVFKLTRIWVMLIFILISAEAFDEIIKNKKEIPLKKIFFSWILQIIFICIAVIGIFKGHIYKYDLGILLLWGSIYILWFALMKKKADSKYIEYILIGLVLVEVILLNYKFINNEQALDRDVWKNGYYSDGTTEIVETIRDDSFYRVDKSYRSVFLDDAKVQNYNGTSYYIGGISIQDWTDFIVRMGLPTMYNQRGYCIGTEGYTIEETLLGVKYGLTKGDLFSSYGYKKVSEKDGIFVYQNQYALPVAFGYTDYIYESDLQLLDLEDRNDALLDYIVIPDGKYEEIEKRLSYKKKEIGHGTIPEKTIIIEDYKIGDIISLGEKLSEDKVAVIQMKDNEEKAVVVQCALNNEWQNNFRYASIYEENGEAAIELCNQKDLNAVVIHPYATKEIADIEEVSIKIYDANQYYEDYVDKVKIRNKNALEIAGYEETDITGEIDCNTDMVLFISIPYNSNFKYYVDGKEVEKYKVDYAFTGIILNKGKHRIQISFND